MKALRVGALASGLVFVTSVGELRAVDTTDTRLLSQLAISAEHIAFIYDGDLWVADGNGGGARRQTTAPGVESNPAFSPDGTLIAFSGHYDGNVDVYVMPVAGGTPTRIT